MRTAAPPARRVLLDVGDCAPQRAVADRRLDLLARVADDDPDLVMPAGQCLDAVKSTGLFATGTSCFALV
jgi:hypothetical protein